MIDVAECAKTKRKDRAGAHVALVMLVGVVPLSSVYVCAVVE
jgi:hypothetical protein